jgi:MFS transporter
MSVLRDRNAALFVAVSLVAGFGGTAMSVTAGVWVMSLTGSASLAGLAGLFVYLPSVAGPLLGVVVDRLPRRRLLIGVNLALGLLLPSLLTVRSAAGVWLIYLVMLGYGVGYVLVDAAESAVLPAAVPGEDLAQLNGLRISAQEGTKLVAPLAGAGLFAWAGGAPVALLCAALLGVSAALYARVRLAPVTADATSTVAPAGGAGAASGAGPAGGAGRARSAGNAGVADADTGGAVRRVWREAREGARALASRPPLPAVIAVAAVAISLAGVATPATYALVAEGLGRPPAFLGVLAALQGAGSIAGGVAAGRVVERLGAAGTCAAGALLSAAGAALHAVSELPAAVAGSVLVGIGLPWTVVATVTAVQRLVPAAMLGRAAATATSLLFAPNALALPVGALAVAYADYRVVLAATALAGAAAGAALLTRVRR